MSSILGLPQEIALHLLSFVSERDKFSSSKVSRAWNSTCEIALKDQYRGEIASMKESLVETLEMEVTDPCPLYSDFPQLAQDLPLFQFPQLETLTELREQMHALRELFPHVIVRAQGTVSLNKRTREITNMDLFHVREEIDQIFAASNLEIPSHLSVNPGDFFIQFMGNKKKGLSNRKLNPSLFTHFAPFSLCRRLPEYFPVAFFSSIKERGTVAFLLKGRILILTVQIDEDLEKEIASPNALPLEDCYLYERDKWDFLSNNLQRRRNLDHALLKSIVLTAPRERTFFFPTVANFLRGSPQGSRKEMQKLRALKEKHPGFFEQRARYIDYTAISANKSRISRYLSEDGDEEIIFLEKFEREMDKIQRLTPLFFRDLSQILRKQVRKNIEFHEIMARVYFFSKTHMDRCNAKLKESLNGAPSLLETRVFQHKMRVFEQDFKCELMQYLHNFIKDTHYGTHSAFCHYFTMFKLGDLVSPTVGIPELAEIYRGVEFGHFCDSFHQREVEIKALTLFD